MKPAHAFFGEGDEAAASLEDPRGRDAEGIEEEEGEEVVEWSVVAKEEEGAGWEEEDDLEGGEKEEDEEEEDEESGTEANDDESLVAVGCAAEAGIYGCWKACCWGIE